MLQHPTEARFVTSLLSGTGRFCPDRQCVRTAIVPGLMWLTMNTSRRTMCRRRATKQSVDVCSTVIAMGESSITLHKPTIRKFISIKTLRIDLYHSLIANNYTHTDGRYAVNKIACNLILVPVIIIII